MQIFWKYSSGTYQTSSPPRTEAHTDNTSHSLQQDRCLQLLSPILFLLLSNQRHTNRCSISLMPRCVHWDAAFICNTLSTLYNLQQSTQGCKSCDEETMSTCWPGNQGRTSHQEYTAGGGQKKHLVLSEDPPQWQRQRTGTGGDGVAHPPYAFITYFSVSAASGHIWSTRIPT